MCNKRLLYPTDRCIVERPGLVVAAACSTMADAWPCLFQKQSGASSSSEADLVAWGLAQRERQKR